MLAVFFNLEVLVLFRLFDIFNLPIGLLITYGPYSLDGVLEPESNRNFDHSLRGMNVEWGIRDIRDLESEAARERLELFKVVDMPANNKMLIFKKL